MFMRRRPMGLLVFLMLAAASPSFSNAQSHERVSCKPVSQRTTPYGCWVLASEPLGALSKPVYWTMDVFPNRQAAEQAKGAGGAVVESLGKVWLLTVGEKLAVYSTGARVAQIGPLPTKAGEQYTARFMEAVLQPGMISETHIHSGAEVFYTESGETCLETPDGKQIGRKGVNVVVPEGVPMELTAIGTEVRRGIILVLHDSSRPATTVVSDWRSKGLCR